MKKTGLPRHRARRRPQTAVAMTAILFLAACGECEDGTTAPPIASELTTPIDVTNNA